MDFYFVSVFVFFYDAASIVSAEAECVAECCAHCALLSLVESEVQIVIDVFIFIAFFVVDGRWHDVILH